MPTSADLKQYNTDTHEETSSPEIADDDMLSSNAIAVNPDSTDPDEIGWKCFADIANLFSELFISIGDADPTAVVADRTQLYLHTGTNAVWISIGGAAWVEYASSGDSVTLQYAETNSTDDDDWHTTKTDDDNFIRVGVGSSATYSSGIQLEAPSLSAGDGVIVSGYRVSVNDDYIEGLIESADLYFEHFRLGYVSSFFTTTESRWGAQGGTIYMQPTVAHSEIVEELLDGAKMQIREPDGSVRNTFTLSADATGPDGSGTYTLNGSYDDTPATFVNGTNYGLYFSQSRPHSIRTGPTITGDGNETPIDVADDSLTDQHLSDSLNASQQAEAQERLGIEDNIAWGGQISISHVAIDNIGAGSNARWALQSSGLNHFLRFEDLSGRDQAYVESLVIGAKIGFYNGDTEAERATLASTWNSTNQRLRITFDTVGSLGSSIDYDLRITQYRPEHGLPPGGDTGQVPKKLSDADYDVGWRDDDEGDGETDLSVAHGLAEVQIQSSTGNPATINAATEAVAGVQSAADKIKLNSLSVGDGGETDLSVVRSASSVEVQSSTGANATIQGASTTAAGVQTAADKAKIGAIPEGGTTGQVIKKQTDANYDTGWEDESGGGAETFSELNDTPAAIVRDRYLKTAVSADLVEYVENAPAAAQRSESVTFQAGSEEIENDGVVISPNASNAIGITFPSSGGGNPQILDAGSNADGFVVLQRGIYYITVRGLVVAVTARCTAQFRIYEYDANIETALPIGRTQNTYIRYQHSNPQPIFEDGILEIAEDNTAVKIVGITALPDAGQPGTDNSRWTLNAGMVLKLYRVGIKGEPGAGVLSEISLANILDEASSTVGGITGRRAKALIDHYIEDVDTFHLTVDRNYVTGTPNAANDITIVLHSGDVYDVGVSRYTGAEALPETYLNALPVNTEIRLVSGDTEWTGELQEIVTETDTSATLRINFSDRTGTFSVNDTVEVSFGYAPARVPRANEIEIEGDLDGNLSESDPDLESVVQSIDNFNLGGDGDFVAAGNDIEIEGMGTEADPKVISNEAPFTEADSDVLGELANTARHTLDDDLVLRLQYGAEHFFDGRSPVITGLAIIDGHIFVGSDDGFVNDQRGINQVGIYDLTTNNNDPAVAGNWYFGDRGLVRVRERSASGLWTNATPSETSVGIANDAGIAMSVDPLNRTVMYHMHVQGDGVRLHTLAVATHPSDGEITAETLITISRASINSILTANDLGTLSEIRNTIGNVGVTAMGALDHIAYIVITGVVNQENGIPVSAILRVTTAGTGAARTFSLDTNYCKIIGISGGVQGIIPTEEGFWISTEHIVYEYHHSIGIGGGGFSSVELGTADLEPSTENRWIATGIQIPTVDDTDYLLVNFGRDIVAGNPGQKRGGEKLVSVSKLRGLGLGTVGGTPTFTGSLNFEDDLSNNVLKLGRLASNELLYASLGPEPAIDFEVRRVLKAETANLVEVNEAFFEGNGSEAEPIDLKANINAANKDAFRARIDAQQNIPMAVYYLKGQTVRNPTTLRDFPPGLGARNDNFCLSFTDVQETIYGGDTAIVPHILWANIDVVADADWNGEGESRSSFTMSAGTYSFVIHVEGEASGDLNTTLQFLVATSGADDVVVSNRPGWSGAINRGWQWQSGSVWIVV